MTEQHIVESNSVTLPTLAINWKQIAPYLIVLFSGANLIFIQWVMVREITTLLLGMGTFPLYLVVVRIGLCV